PKQPPLAVGVVGSLRERPLDAAAGVEVFVVANAGDVTGLTAGESLQNLKCGRGGGPFPEQFAAAPAIGDESEDREITERLPGRPSRRLDKSPGPCPGPARTFWPPPTRRSELMNVPSFSPQPAAGSTRCAIRAVSVEAYMSCTTRKSRRLRTSRA